MSAPLVTDLLRPFLVEEVMTSPVFTAGPFESLLSAARTMRTHHVSGLPVIDPKGHVLGVLSEKDIVASLDHQVGIGHVRGILDVLLAGYEPKRKDLLQRSVAALLNGVVQDAMSHPAATVDEDAPLSEAWHLLRQFSINRLPVVRGDRLSGILTRQDVLKVLAAPPSPVAPARKTPAPKNRVRA
ncbi:MAG: CBS domain-containing protein [Thermoplasmata archaeon]|nr:CBS domain-containing protein [Thermoplasmata archaeon]